VPGRIDLRKGGAFSTKAAEKEFYISKKEENLKNYIIGKDSG
jgi:hypothetical protein